MSLESGLQERKAVQREYVAAKDVPEKAKLKIVDYKFKTDEKGTEGCYIYLKFTNGKFTVQKYTPTAFVELREALLKAGGAEALKTKFHTWEQKIAGRMTYPRLFPVAAAKKEE